MRVVLDTNILARAYTGPSGPAAEVLRVITAPDLLVVSPFILSELTRALGYDRLRRMHGRDEAGIATAPGFPGSRINSRAPTVIVPPKAEPPSSMRWSPGETPRT